MIEEIIKLRNDGLSFRKIASELNTSVGKVQYRFNKWIHQEQEKSKGLLSNPFIFVPEKGTLHLKLIHPGKLALIWEPSNLPKKVIELYFNQKFESLVHTARIYDVTDLIFNGKNAHYFHEVALPYQNGHWVVKGVSANRHYAAELGVKFSENSFFPILRSDSVQIPKLEMPNGNDITADFLPIQQNADEPPKWTKHVSTYGYYEETN